MIVQDHLNELRNGKIAEKYSRSKATIQKVMKSEKNGGLESALRSGGPRTSATREENKKIREAISARFIQRRL